MNPWRKSSYSATSACVEWRKSSYSVQGDCVEFRKSSRSGGGECVEVATDHIVQVRDSKDPDGAILVFTPAAWRAFLATEMVGR